MPREGALLREYQAMHEKNFSAVGCGRMWSVKEKKEKMNTEAKEEESRSGKREVEGEKVKVETSSKRLCLYRLSRKVFRGPLSRF